MTVTEGTVKDTCSLRTETQAESLLTHSEAMTTMLLGPVWLSPFHAMP